MKRLVKIGLVVVVALALSLATLDLNSATQLYSGAGLKQQRGLGSQHLTPTVSTALTLPTGTKHAIISIRSYGVYFTEDATAASSANGGWLPVGTILAVNNDAPYLAALRFIDTSDGASTVYVSYTGDR